MLLRHNQVFTAIKSQHLTVSLARDASSIEEAQRLRYQVFAEEMGAKIVSDKQLDIDHYDPFCQHLIVRETENQQVIGCYRLLTHHAAQAAGGWYSQSEFDLSRLQHILPRTVELGRACVHADYRNGGTIGLLWMGLAQYMQNNDLEYMIGCGSVDMLDGGHMAASLFRELEKKHYADNEYRVFPHHPLPLASLQQDLQVATPALIKGYLRAGAKICGEPAWDPDFNCADMLVMMAMNELNPRYAKHFLS